jgi:stress-induced morphogen
MAVPASTILSLLQAGFPDGEFSLKDTVGDMDHYELSIKSSRFNGATMVAQHKMVMEALGSIVGKELHAISIKSSPKN